MLGTGFSMVEALMVAAILALAILPVIDVFRSSGQSLQQTLPYHGAVFLGEKCVEESRLGAHEDPYFVSRVLVEGYGSDAAAVAGGGSPFFGAIEDSAAPFGRIEPGVDLAVQKEAGPLFEQLRPFTVAVRGSLTEKSPPEPSEAEATAVFDWEDGRGKQMRYEIGTALRVWVPLEALETEPAPDEDLDLGKALDAGQGKPFTALAGERAADAKKLGALARLLLEGGRAKAAAEQHAPALDGLAADRAATTGLERARATMRQARLEEAMASRLLGLLGRIRPALEELGAGAPPGSLGTPVPAEAQRKLALDLVRHAVDRFYAHLAAALAMYSAGAAESFLPSGWRAAAHAGAMRTVKVAAAAVPWADHSSVAAYARNLAAHYKGRSPHVAHLYETEAQLAADPAHFTLGQAASEAHRCREHFLSAALALLLYKETPEP